MALSSPPPWESFGFPDILNFGVTGARLGMERAAQTQQALEESARLGLSYSQLASENSRAAMAAGGAAQRESAADALERERLRNQLQIATMNAVARQQAQEALNQYRMGTLATRLRDKEPPEVGQLDIGGGKTLPYLWSRSTGVFQIPQASLLEGKKGGLTDSQLLNALMKEKSSIEKKYADPLTARLMQNDPTAKAQHDSDMSKLKAIQGQIDRLVSGGGRAPGDTLTQPGPELPTPSGSGVIKVQRDASGRLVVPGADTSASPAGQTPAASAAPALPPIPGLAPPGQAVPPGLAAAQSRIAARQGRAEAAARADLQSQIDTLRTQLSRANTGKGTFMGQEEYADKYAQLQQLISRLPPAATPSPQPSAADSLSPQDTILSTPPD